MKVVVLNSSLLALEPLANGRLDPEFWLAVNDDMRKNPDADQRQLIRYQLVMHRKEGIGSTIKKAHQ